MNAYVYYHIDPITQDVFYIGKGTNNRLRHIYDRSPHHKNKLKKLLTHYKIEDIAFKVQDCLSDTDAFKLEIELIEKFKLKSEGGTLLNICRGGQGISSQLVTGKNNVNYRDILESDYLNLLSKGNTNKVISKTLNVDQNTLKAKFYPKISLKEYCVYHNIDYVNTQKAVKNGNYKEFDSVSFIKLVKAGCSLTIIEKELQLSKRCIIKKYRDVFNVKNWRELKEALS